MNNPAEQSLLAARAANALAITPASIAQEFDAVREKIEKQDNILGQLLERTVNDREVLDGLYMRAYSRKPTGKEWRAVASFLGAFLCLQPLTVAVTSVIFIAAVAATRYISLGSILGAAFFPFGVWLISHPDWTVVASAAGCGALVIWRHHANIGRLLAGTENVFRFGGKR